MYIPKSLKLKWLLVPPMILIHNSALYPPPPPPSISQVIDTWSIFYVRGDTVTNRDIPIVYLSHQIRKCSHPGHHSRSWVCDDTDIVRTWTSVTSGKINGNWQFASKESYSHKVATGISIIDNWHVSLGPASFTQATVDSLMTPLAPLHNSECSVFISRAV